MRGELIEKSRPPDDYKREGERQQVSRTIALAVLNITEEGVNMRSQRSKKPLKDRVKKN